MADTFAGARHVFSAAKNLARLHLPFIHALRFWSQFSRMTTQCINYLFLMMKASEIFINFSIKSRIIAAFDHKKQYPSSTFGNFLIFHISEQISVLLPSDWAILSVKAKREPFSRKNGVVNTSIKKPYMYGRWSIARGGTQSSLKKRDIDWAPKECMSHVNFFLLYIGKWFL